MLSSLLQVDVGADTRMTQQDVADTCMSNAAKGGAWFLVGVGLLEAVVFYGLAQTMHKRSRTFHTFAYLLMLIPVVGYVSMLSGVGLHPLSPGYGAERCFFTGRWMMLLLEVPLLVVTAGLLAGMVSFDLSVLAIASFGAVASGLVGGLIDGSNRWLMFASALLFALPVLRTLWNRFYTTGTEAYEHEYTSVVANRLSFLCTTLVLYLLTTFVFWSMCQGANVIRSSTEILILAIVDILFISAFTIGLLSDHESISKMSELNARSLGWLRGGGSSEYSSITESGGAGKSTYSGMAQ